MRRNLDNIVLIDVDCDSVPNVIIIDVPESLQQKLRGSRVQKAKKNFSVQTVISIDDDGSSDDENYGSVPGGNLDDNASLGERSSAPSSHFQTGEDLVGDECQSVNDRKSPLNLSTGKRTYSGTCPLRNRYGLFSEFENDSSGSDCSDCELMESSLENFRELWENASLKRKRDFRGNKSGSNNHAQSSRSYTDDILRNAEVNSSSNQYSEVPVCNINNANYDEEIMSEFTETGAGNSSSTSCNPTVESPFAEFDIRSVEGTQISYREAGVQDRAEMGWKDLRMSHAASQTSEHIDPGSAGFCHEEELNCHGPFTWSSQVQDCATKYFLDPGLSVNFDLGKSNVQNEEFYVCKMQHSVETAVDHGRDIFVDKNEGFQQAPSDCCTHYTNESKHEEANFREKEKSFSVAVSILAQQSDEAQVHHGIGPSVDEIGASKGLSFCNAQHGETLAKCGVCTLMKVKKPGVESVCCSQMQGPLHSRDADAVPAVHSCIINGREKMKETDEYKKAVEEEWASRQRQLQIQAEEAQRLRKRKKVENMRLLDMERRQKLRLEEIREAQKKDEENMNLKEQLRIEVMGKLNNLEKTCTDMASLLRCLGIQVGSGFYPFSHEVQAAYKRALLRFHPDRASRTDIRQQVEAEEKFKLISRMKEKLLPA